MMVGTFERDGVCWWLCVCGASNVEGVDRCGVCSLGRDGGV